MKRRALFRDIFRLTTATGLAATLPRLATAAGPAHATAAQPLAAPAEGAIPVAFLLSPGAVVIDFAGPWEVFCNASVPDRAGPAFRPYTVAETAAPIQASGGMRILPDYLLTDAPAPKVIVIPAQAAPGEAVLAWVRAAAGKADLTMSVCTGAFLLAQTGLLKGKGATTHHGAFKEFAMRFPDVALRRGARYVEEGNLASSGGLSSGIDLALRVVERYFGRAAARRTADAMEYQGQGWLDPASNMVYAKRPVSTAAHPLCPVCDMEVEKNAAASVFRGRTYRFCAPEHKAQFDANPAAFIAA